MRDIIFYTVCTIALLFNTFNIIWSLPIFAGLFGLIDAVWLCLPVWFVISLILIPLGTFSALEFLNRKL